MRATLDLYSLKLTENDTMWFSSLTEQKKFFDEENHETVDIAYNGFRNIKLIGFNWEKISLMYNYVRLTVNNVSYYGRIYDYIYVNDNTTEISFNLDLYQTFLDDIEISDSVVANKTIKQSDLDKKYYHINNYINANDYDIQTLTEYVLAQHNYNSTQTILERYERAGYILITLNGKPAGSRVNEEGNYAFLSIINGQPQSFATIAIPITIATTIYVNGNKVNTIKSNSYMTKGAVRYPVVGRYTGMMNLIERLSPNISYIGLKFHNLDSTTIRLDKNPDLSDCSVEIVTTNNYLRIEAVAGSTSDYHRVPIINSTYDTGIMSKEIDLTEHIKRNRYKYAPYFVIRIGNALNNIMINLNDFERNFENNILKVNSRINILPPYNTVYDVFFGNKKLVDKYILLTSNDNYVFPYAINQYQEYITNNQQYAFNGLETRQFYERKNFSLSQMQEGIEIGGNLISDLAQIGTMENAGKASVAKGTSAINTSLSVSKMLFNRAKFNNNQQLDKELRNIKYSDLKTAPQALQSMVTSLYDLMFFNTIIPEIQLLTPRNIDYIKNYHNKYGFELNIVEKVNLKDIKKHLLFDYISFKQIELAKPLIMLYKNGLEEQFKNGVRFWYDYKKFLNFDEENKEI